MLAKWSSQFRPYGVGILAVLLALGARVLFNPVIGRDRFFFVTFLLAVVFCAWYCGIGPTILVVVLSGLSAWLFVFSPEIIAHNQPLFWGTTLSFGVVSFVVIIIAASQRRVRDSLKARVNERTAELIQANGILKTLSVRLIELQDDERRRIARELHDSAGQLLAALSMNISALGRIGLAPRAQKLQEDSYKLVQELLRQIRT